MGLFDAIVWGVVACIWVGCLWHMRCSYKTLQDRRRLLHNCPEYSIKRAKIIELFHKELDEVSFNRHLWARFFFRDPHHLYGPVCNFLWDQALPPEEDWSPEPDRAKEISDAHAYYTALTEVE